ncbi:hypothetical protein MNBD_GAMMA12-2650 [hydrothermal vent metagenome]|uniref:Uncharacterized protein n=1 Tax=hydrothermal vent metagenome TaxID=652676 RepID=A0A3B0YGZ1_9ZZZZ
MALVLSIFASIFSGEIMIFSYTSTFHCVYVKSSKFIILVNESYNCNLTEQPVIIMNT